VDKQRLERALRAPVLALLCAWGREALNHDTGRATHDQGALDKEPSDLFADAFAL
jgi:hypothetical protein